MNKNQSLLNQSTFNQILATAVAAASMGASVPVTAKVLPEELYTRKVPSVSRGADVGTLAGNCDIGSFKQTGKAGAYNALCSQMEDAEKCLGFIKQHFQSNGTAEKTHEPDKMAYCLEELDRVFEATPAPTP